jgi:8-oxo-dGTP pyrophosphatase MutT (NUDIX family)
VVEDLSAAREVLAANSGKKKWYRRWTHRSAVALILRQHSQRGVEVLMIQRAEREGDPWSGHMAFPGGRLDSSDAHSLAAATRETWEEIGLAETSYSDCLTRLSDIVSRPHKGWRPMVISSFVFSINSVPELKLNHEVADTLWVPLSFIADHNNREQMQWQMKNTQYTLPCYFYQQQRIWGLSLLMLDELVGWLVSKG